MVFGIRFRQQTADAKQGHLRLVVNEAGEVRELDLLSDLRSDEAGPALTEAFVATNDLSEAARQTRLDKLLAAGRKEAGLLDRVRGKAKDREGEALGAIPAELFRGSAGPVTVTVDGRYAVVLIEVEAEAPAAVAILRAPDAIEAACKVADEGWLEAVRAVAKEAESEDQDQAQDEAQESERLMTFRQLFDPVSSTYTYLLADEDGNAALIDPVFEHHARDLALIRELELKLLYTIETHVHADHVTGAWLMRDATGAQIVLSEGSGAPADRLLATGETLAVGALKLEARATPGHTGGCMTFVDHAHGRAFTGDTLLIRGAGRTDFQEGSAQTLFASIREQIFTLPDETLIYPGHDYSGRTVTTVAEEKRHNPRVGGEASEGDFVGYMNNLNLPHPKKIDVAVPANLKLGEPEDGKRPPQPSWAPVHRSFAGVLELDVEWLRDHPDAVVVVDVREASELTGELGRIRGAKHIPLGELKDRSEELPAGPLVCVCRSGRRSARAAQILEKAGHSEVANLSGGMLEWNARRYPTG